MKKILASLLFALTMLSANADCGCIKGVINSPGGLFTGDVNISSPYELQTNTIDVLNATDTLTLPHGFSIQDVIGDGTMFGVAYVASGSLQAPIVETHDGTALKLNGNNATVDNTGKLTVNSLYTSNIRPHGLTETITLGNNDGPVNINGVTISGSAITGATISGSSNTFSNIGNSSLTNSSVTLNGTAVSLGASGTVPVNTTSTTTNASYYPLFVSSSSNGNQTVNLGTGLTFNPSTNTLTTTTFSGAFSGTATNATNTAITEDTSTNASVYPTWVTANTGNLPQKTTSTKLTFNPSTGVLSSTSFTGAGTGLTGTASSLTVGAVSNSLTVGTGLKLDSGTTFNGSAAKTISPSLPYVQLTKNATQSLTSSTETAINWNTAQTANTNLWTNSNQSRLLCAYTGLYNIQAQLEFQPSSSSRNYINISMDGSSLGLNRDSFASNSIYTNLNISFTLPCTAGHYFEITAYSAGATGTIDANQNEVTFTYLGAAA